MNSLFIGVLNKKFANQFMVQTNESETFIKFPAISSDFGDINIYEEAPGIYIIEVGKFTHIHIDIYDGTDDEKAEEAAEEASDFLAKLFTNCFICYGSHESGGGCFEKEYESEEGFDWTDLCVWSGIYKKAHPE